MREIERFPNLGNNLCENDKQTLHDYHLVNNNISNLSLYFGDLYDSVPLVLYEKIEGIPVT